MRAAVKEPYKISLLIRFSTLPLIVKNFGIPLLNIKFLPFLVSSFIQ